VSGVAVIEQQLPRFEMLTPVLELIKEKGGSATVQEIDEGVIEMMAIPPEQQEVLHGDGPRTEIGYRLAWCRTYLRMVGALEHSARGVWTITDEGRKMTPEQIAGVPARVHAMRKQLAKEKGDEEPEETDTTELADEGTGPHLDGSWKEQLLELLVGLEPAAFERLCQRLLREAGFISVTVTGRSGDGGIDGIGVLQMSLLSFPVFFQSKKYKGSVGPSAVRDFRGAMAGRGDKGLLITTGSFSTDAKKEARRDGAPPIDLIDGDRLCELLKEYGLGVRTVEAVTLDAGWFTDL
jgi:restriction system protein